jgi:hypothetical protein
MCRTLYTHKNSQLHALSPLSVTGNVISINIF